MESFNLSDPAQTTSGFNLINVCNAAKFSSFYSAELISDLAHDIKVFRMPICQVESGNISKFFMSTVMEFYVGILDATNSILHLSGFEQRFSMMP